MQWSRLRWRPIACTGRYLVGRRMQLSSTQLERHLSNDFPRRSSVLAATSWRPFLPLLGTSQKLFSTSTDTSATIYALSTAPGTAAIAIIRISGAACLSIYQALCPDKGTLKPRYATVRTLYDPEDPSQKLDANALVIFFPAPQTVTGEDVLELHVHGGNAVVKTVLSAIPRAANSKDQQIRYAEPGEFTRRAFYNQRLDLTEVEALGDTLAAETEQQRRLAVRGASNVLATHYEEWRQKLLYARGELEALIDFSEDQQFDDSPDMLLKSVTKQVSQLQTLLDVVVQNAFRGELLRTGLNIALIGAPNAGKSSLLNRIVKREAAIVSKEAGTTRDVVDVGVDIGGYYCKFGDLAGLRRARVETDVSEIGDIESEGIRRAKERALHADVVVIVLSIEARADSSGGLFEIELNDEVAETIKRLDPDRQDVLYVVNKSDLLPREKHRKRMIVDLQQSLDAGGYPLSQHPPLTISCLPDPPPPLDNLSKGTDGIQELLQALITTFERKTSVLVPKETHVKGLSSRREMWAESLGASERHRLLLQQCASQLKAFLHEASNTRNEQSDKSNEAEFDVVVAAEELRHAADCLARITGKGESGGVEEVLGVVFEKFCVGK